MPETRSVPAKVTPTGWLYHPFASGFRSGIGDTAGAPRSILTTFLTLIDVPSPQEAVQATARPVVSAVSVTASHPLEEDGSGLICQLTVTLLRYHPLTPAVP